MLKLMKYEFRKLRNTLLIMLAALAALEIGFLVGEAMEKTGLMTVSLVLISVLVFLVYAFIILAGMASYSRELKEKSGYLVFMVPVRPIGVVLSKLVFTAVAASAVFGAVAYFDFRYLIDKMDIDPDVMNQINMLLRFGLKANANVMQILRMAGFYALTMLIEILLTMCTAYLAITLSATMLQNKKGFLRAMISLVLFVALTWGANWLVQRLIYDRVALDTPFAEMTGTIAWSLLFNLALSAAFVGASAWLLDHRVNL